MRKIVIALFTFLSSGVYANNITVSNVQLTGQNVAAGPNNATNFTLVQFNLSWENSWRFTAGPGNWDAAWVFVKYRVGTGDWQHARLNNTGHTAPVGSTIDAGLQTPGTAFNATTNPGIGVFIYRSAAGTGTFSISTVQLRWNYGANGVVDNDIVDVRVFALEMVYVPQGSFNVGDGSTTSVNGQFRNGSTNTPLLISSENALTLGGTANGNLANNNTTGMSTVDDFNNTTTQNLPAAFPKGFNAFYCMKYEISQQAYVDFLNCLNRAQQANRVATNVASGTTTVTNRYVMSNNSSLQFRNGIRCNATISGIEPLIFYCDLNGNDMGGEVGDGQWIACNYLRFMDVAAYLDWSGLRPMTELEFEKSCRGPLVPSVNEYAWGSTSITVASNITNSGTNNETSNTAGANSIFNNNVTLQGPLRTGIFATSNSTRTLSGAGYYGIMELSGNLCERPVTVGNAIGRGFTGKHGNGALSANGNANVMNWPGLMNGEVTGANGVGLRGGGWKSIAERLRASDRGFASIYEDEWGNDFSGRGVRISP